MDFGVDSDMMFVNSLWGEVSDTIKSYMAYRVGIYFPNKNHLNCVDVQQVIKKSKDLKAIVVYITTSKFLFNFPLILCKISNFKSD